MFGYPRPHPPLNYSWGRSPGVKASIMENSFVKTPVKDYMSTKGYDLCSPIRSSKESGYLFVTFLNSSNPEEAENIWLSVKASSRAEAGKTIDRNWSVVETVNAAGQPRLKLTDSGEDARATLLNRGYVAL